MLNGRADHRAGLRRTLPGLEKAFAEMGKEVGAGNRRSGGKHESNRAQPEKNKCTAQPVHQAWCGADTGRSDDRLPRQPARRARLLRHQAGSGDARQWGNDLRGIRRSDATWCNAWPRSARCTRPVRMSGNPVAVAARWLRSNSFRQRAFTEPLQTVQAIDEVFGQRQKYGIPFCAQSVGGMFGLYFSKALPTSYAEVMSCDKEAFNRFFHAMLDAGRVSRRRLSRRASFPPRTRRRTLLRHVPAGQDFRDLEVMGLFHKRRSLLPVRYKDLPLQWWQGSGVRRAFQCGQVERNQYIGESCASGLYQQETPGRTQHLNYFSLGNNNFLVDFAGLWLCQSST